MPTVTVAPSGGDYTTITDALAAISDASPSNIYTILVEAGTYPETGRYGLGLMLKDYVDIEGTDRDTVIIQSDGGGADHQGI
jgi:pectin methylesterase-like acyl-CoA thioesterase